MALLATAALVAGCAGQSVRAGDAATTGLTSQIGESTASLSVISGAATTDHTTGGTSADTSTSSTTTTSAAPTTTTKVAPPVLHHPRWSALPDAPIVGRENGASAWTGTAWIIWGGNTMQSSKYFADGASYDPAARLWTTLPAAPISARSGAVSVWTGTSLFVWGGQDAKGGSLQDGALYTPGTSSWTTVSTPPNLPRADSSHQLSVQAVWTGSRVALVGIRDGDTSGFVRFYDPVSRSWSGSTSVGLNSAHHGQLVAATAIGSSVYLFVYWLHSRPYGNGGTQTTVGTDGFTLDAAGRATPNGLAPKARTVAPTVMSLGPDLLFPPGQSYCGFCPGPVQLNLHSVLVDPATGMQTNLPHGPADDHSPVYVPANDDLIASGTALYDSTAGSWRTLPEAPLTGAGFSTWTGSALLEWGEMYEPKTADTGKTQFLTAGLELTG